MFQLPNEKMTNRICNPRYRILNRLSVSLGIGLPSNSPSPGAAGRLVGGWKYPCAEPLLVVHDVSAWARTVMFVELGGRLCWSLR